VQAENIVQIEKLFASKTLRYSTLLSGEPIGNQQILIIDNIGLLSRIYRYGDAAIIGGGFWENGLHNTLEAAAFGMPISFGPKLKRFPEAQELVQEAIGTITENKIEFISWLNTCLNSSVQRKAVAVKSRNFVAANKGATEKVLKKIQSIMGQ
jgi:3-deoxy-D-manno-octulosonic-acid transferase